MGVRLYRAILCLGATAARVRLTACDARFDSIGSVGSRMDAGGADVFVTRCGRRAKCLSRAALASVLLTLMMWGACSAQTMQVDSLLRWVPFLQVPGVVDLSVPRRDGSLTVTAGGQLFLLEPTGTLRTFAREPGGYATSPGAEAYLVLAQRRRVPGAQCAFRRDDVYALEVAPP